MAGFLVGAGAGRRGGRVTAVVKALPWQQDGARSLGGPQAPAACGFGEGGLASALRGGQRRWDRLRRAGCWCSSRVLLLGSVSWFSP